MNRAVRALGVGRSQQVRRELGRMEKELAGKTISISGEEDLGVVCWMALLPPADG